jgi:uncharacterized protein
VKVLLDSSVLVSAFLTPAGRGAALLRAGMQGHYEPCISEGILTEIALTLRGKSKLKARYRYKETHIAEYIEDLCATMTVIQVLKSIKPVCRDPADDHVLAAALAAKTDFIVTGDDDLLSLGRYKNIRIVTVRKFLDDL